MELSAEDREQIRRICRAARCKPAHVPNLTALYARGNSGITDAGLAHLPALTTLDAGLAHLPALTTLDAAAAEVLADLAAWTKRR